VWAGVLLWLLLLLHSLAAAFDDFFFFCLLVSLSASAPAWASAYTPPSSSAWVRGLFDLPFGRPRPFFGGGSADDDPAAATPSSCLTIQRSIDRSIDQLMLIIEVSSGYSLACIPSAGFDETTPLGRPTFFVAFMPR